MLDAADVLLEGDRKVFLTLDPAVSVVMAPTTYQERLIRNWAGIRWAGTAAYDHPRPMPHEIGS